MTNVDILAGAIFTMMAILAAIFCVYWIICFLSCRCRLAKEETEKDPLLCQVTSSQQPEPDHYEAQTVALDSVFLDTYAE